MSTKLNLPWLVRFVLFLVVFDVFFLVQHYILYRHGDCYADFPASVSNSRSELVTWSRPWVEPTSSASLSRCFLNFEQFCASELRSLEENSTYCTLKTSHSIEKYLNNGGIFSCVWVADELISNDQSYSCVGPRSPTSVLLGSQEVVSWKSGERLNVDIIRINALFLLWWYIRSHGQCIDSLGRSRFLWGSPATRARRTPVRQSAASSSTR